MAVSPGRSASTAEMSSTGTSSLPVAGLGFRAPGMFIGSRTVLEESLSSGFRTLQFRILAEIHHETCGLDLRLVGRVESAANPTR